MITTTIFALVTALVFFITLEDKSHWDSEDYLVETSVFKILLSLATGIIFAFMYSISGV